MCYAEVLMAQQKLNEASEAYTKVVALCPEAVEARVNLAVIQEELGLTDKALETLKDRALTPERFDVDEVEFKVNTHPLPWERGKIMMYL